MINAYAATEAGGKLSPFQYDPGELAPDQVEIDVAHCGICHSDLSMLNNEWGISQYPLVPGHEVVGTVAATGDMVTHLKPGQKVGLGWHSGYCMSCRPCVSGDHNLCPDSEPTIVGHHGGFADKVRAKAPAVIPLPDGLDFISAGPLLCGGITVFNPLVQFDIPPTAEVAVVGIGGLGHMALAFLNAWGCKVTAFTSSEAKREEALKLGAHETINSRDSSEIKAAAGRFDLVLSTVNVALDWPNFLGTLAPKGRFHFLGATIEPISVDIMPMLFGQHSISASPVGSPATIAQMLDFAARHDIRPVIEKFRFDQINEAIEHLEKGDARYRIVLSH
ncbi:NAD(P)-dependent alcohol dehydrogenase [Haloferula chungangensis]|uniref:NAD(P)-dependent alcohol dehydrogenase n=1 Tax=Haloferula chungangensis TaxID=1048331 RepID=A0ABW2L8R3_9BACT